MLVILLNRLRERKCVCDDIYVKCMLQKWAVSTLPRLLQVPPYHFPEQRRAHRRPRARPPFGRLGPAGVEGGGMFRGQIALHAPFPTHFYSRYQTQLWNRTFTLVFQLRTWLLLRNEQSDHVHHPSRRALSPSQLGFSSPASRSLVVWPKRTGLPKPAYQPAPPTAKNSHQPSRRLTTHAMPPSNPHTATGNFPSPQYITTYSSTAPTFPILSNLTFPLQKKKKRWYRQSKSIKDTATNRIRWP